ncbi:hypothetical protein CUMW_003060 [Citrus unshiu]|nr:hypothetical protein CUMW_003060 [Citrus unshiu]
MDNLKGGNRRNENHQFRVGLFVARSFTGHAIMWGARNGVLFKKQVLCVSMKAIIILLIHLTRISPSLREKNVK